MSWYENLLRRARIRGLREGKVQQARVEALENDAKDQAERWQDYGFAAQPVEGQGLVINAGGHTIVLRMDRLAERPELEALEVAVWHKEGHMVRLRAGRLVQVDCDTLRVNAAVKVEINSPVVEANASTVVALNTPNVAASTKVTAPTLQGNVSVVAGGKELVEHVHGGVSPGVATTDVNQ